MLRVFAHFQRGNPEFGRRSLEDHFGGFGLNYGHEPKVHGEPSLVFPYPFTRGLHERQPCPPLYSMTFFALVTTKVLRAHAARIWHFSYGLKPAIRCVRQQSPDWAGSGPCVTNVAERSIFNTNTYRMMSSNLDYTKRLCG